MVVEDKVVIFSDKFDTAALPPQILFQLMTSEVIVSVSKFRN